MSFSRIPVQLAGSLAHGHRLRECASAGCQNSKL